MGMAGLALTRGGVAAAQEQSAAERIKWVIFGFMLQA